MYFITCQNKFTYGTIVVAVAPHLYAVRTALLHHHCFGHEWQNGNRTMGNECHNIIAEERKRPKVHTNLILNAIFGREMKTKTFGDVYLKVYIVVNV